MGVRKHARPRNLALWVIPVVAVLVMAAGYMTSATAHAEGDGPSMALSVTGTGTSCDADECSVPLEGEFTLSVDVVEPPEQGYILMQTFIDYGQDLTYSMTDTAIEEVIWPDAVEDVTLRGAIGPGLITHGGLTSLLPPQPVSTYVGTVVEIAMTCTDSFSETEVVLRPLGDPVAGANGSLFTYLVDFVDIQAVPKTDAVTVLCGERPPEPTEDDDDGSGGQPTALPPSGVGNVGTDQDAGTGLWVIIATLAVLGTVSLVLSGWRIARSRQLR